MNESKQTAAGKTASSILDIQQVCENCAIRIAKSLKGKTERVRFAVGKQYNDKLRFELTFDVMPKNVQIKFDYEQEHGESIPDFIERVFNKLGG